MLRSGALGVLRVAGPMLAQSCGAISARLGFALRKRHFATLIAC